VKNYTENILAKLRDDPKQAALWIRDLKFKIIITTLRNHLKERS